MPRVKHHRSSRRVPPPKDSDFDHEINLVDHSPSPRTSGQDDDSLRIPPHAGPGASTEPHRGPPDTDAADAPDARVTSGDADRGAGVVPDGVVSNGPNQSPSEAPDGPVVQVEQPTPLQNVPNQPGAADRAAETRPKPKTKPKTPESEIDILYENQRGGFLCGIPLFSSMALGNLDPPAWTNFAHKASPTNIHTAQVPDPSWEWAWPEWKINLEDGVDEDGWEYSFMFSRHFSWHKAKWWNSFVRRRAWIRKRVKKDAGYVSHDPNMLNPEYFSVRPSSEMGRSSSRRGSVGHRSNRTNRTSMSTANDADELPPPDIESVEELLRVLGESRIDREKIDAVDNYLEHAEDDLSGLQNVMHEIMSVFVFQASRRVLLSRLTRVYDEEAAEERKGRGGKDTEDGGKAPSKRVENLAAAVKHADEEVRRLEYWSDVKGITAEGDSKGAVDESKGWDPGWEGLDRSGPPAPPKPE